MGARGRVSAGGDARGHCWFPIAVLLPVALVEKILLIGVVVLVLIVELLNTGIEAAVDRDSFEINPLGKRAKDFGSAAVMFSLLLAGWHLDRDHRRALPVSAPAALPSGP